MTANVRVTKALASRVFRESSNPEAEGELLIDVGLELRGQISEKIYHESKRRNTSPSLLVGNLVLNAVKNGLFSAILDD